MLLLDGSQPVSFRRNKMKMPSWKKATRRDPPCKGYLQIIHKFMAFSGFSGFSGFSMK